jgi:hypothetical protein
MHPELGPHPSLPPGVTNLGPVQPGQITGQPGGTPGKPAATQGSASPAVTVYGPYNIVPHTDHNDGADAYFSENPTYAWLYPLDNTPAQLWSFVSGYTIGGYTGDTIQAYYGGHDMCMNVRGNNYTQGTQIWVNDCDTTIYLNELWILNAFNVNGAWVYALCSAYDNNLCINVAGGIAPYYNLIVWNLNQLYPNSIWDLIRQ